MPASSFAQFPPEIFLASSRAGNTRSFKEIFENEEENIALFSGGIDDVPYGGGAGREDAAADVLV
jgi:hypothetical protein